MVRWNAGELPAGDQAMSSAGIAEVSRCISTLRATRRFRADDIDPALLHFVLYHATRAGSGSNRQPWRFIVVRDRTVRAELARWYANGWRYMEEHGYTVRPGGPGTKAGRLISARARQLAAHFKDAPVVIVPCFLPGRHSAADIFGGASVYPAVQNLLLAARAVGLGTVLTTIQALSGLDRSGTPTADAHFYLELKAILAIPPSPVPVAVIPMGWPEDPAAFGEVDRRPPGQVSFTDRWGGRDPLLTTNHDAGVSTDARWPTASPR
jgi:nitroreductase